MPQPTDDVFTQIGAGDLPDEEKSALLTQMLQSIQVRVMSRVDDLLQSHPNTTLIEEFYAILEKEDMDGLDVFLETNVPDIANMYEEEGRKLRHELMVAQNPILSGNTTTSDTPSTTIA